MPKRMPDIVYYSYYICEDINFLVGNNKAEYDEMMKNFEKGPENEENTMENLENEAENDEEEVRKLESRKVLVFRPPFLARPQDSDSE